MAAAVQGANSDEYATARRPTTLLQVRHDDPGPGVTLGDRYRLPAAQEHRARRVRAGSAMGGATMRLAASKVRGHKVINYDNEDLGTIEDFVLDMATGRPGYAILSYP